jgi:hypothetical protein
MKTKAELDAIERELEAIKLRMETEKTKPKKKVKRKDNG